MVNSLMLTMCPLGSTSILLKWTVNLYCVLWSVPAEILYTPGERLTQRGFEKAPLDALLDVNEGLSQDSYRAADHLRSPAAAARRRTITLQLLQPGTHRTLNTRSSTVRRRPRAAVSGTYSIHSQRPKTQTHLQNFFLMLIYKALTFPKFTPSARFIDKEL